MFLFRFISCEGGFVQSELVCIVFLSYDLVNVDSVATAIFSFLIWDVRWSGFYEKRVSIED